jgi:hypothetical protein
MVEHRNVLRDAIFQNGEIVFRQIRHEGTLIGGNADIQQHQTDIAMQNKISCLIVPLIICTYRREKVRCPQSQKKAGA